MSRWMKRVKMHELNFFENKAEQNFHKWTSESALSENHRFEFLKISIFLALQRQRDNQAHLNVFMFNSNLTAEWLQIQHLLHQLIADSLPFRSVINLRPIYDRTDLNFLVGCEYNL